MADSYNTILVPLDGSEVANQALPHAQQLAAKFDAELVLFRVVPDAKTSLDSIHDILELDLKIEHQQYLVDHASRWLARLADEMALHHIRTRPEVDVGEAADRIIDYTLNHEVDLIVMSTHGRTGVARWIYGSVAAKVLASAKCPVLLVRSQWPETVHGYTDQTRAEVSSPESQVS